MKKITFLATLAIVVIMLSVAGFAQDPGLNIFTGTSGALTFDDLTEVPSFVSNATLSQSPVSGESGKVLLHSHNESGTYGTMPFVVSPAADSYRPYRLDFKMYVKANEGYGTNRILWIMKNGTSGWQKAWSGAGPTANSSTWRTYSMYLENLATLVNTSTSAADTTPLSKLIFEFVYDAAADAGVNKWVYIDDVSLVPAYLITYIGKDGNTVKTEYVEGTTYTPVLTDAEAQSGIAGWSLTNGGDAVTSVTLANKDITLYAVNKKEAVPGLNYFTGTTSSLTFDNLTDVPSYIQSAALVATPIEGDSGKALLHTHSGTGTYATLPFVFDPALDCERPYLFEYKMYEKANNGLGSNRSLWVMKNSTAGWQKAWSGAGPVANASDWRAYSHYLDNLGSLVNTNTEAEDKTAVSKLILEWIYDSAAEVGVNHWVYVDDVSLVPAYLITYLDKDGKTIKTEYSLPDTNTFVPEVTEEDAQNNIIGWSVNNDGTADSSVALNNKDFSLYAVYGKPQIDVEMPSQTVTPGINLLTGTADAYTFDEDTTLPSFVSGAELVNSPYANEAGKAVKHISSGAQYGIVGFALNPAVDCERAYQVSFKLYYESTDEANGEKDSMWILKNGTSKWQIADTATNILFNAQNWYEYSNLLENLGSLINGENVDKTAVSKINLEWTYEGVGGTNQFVYVDDVSIVPAYYVAFVGEDGKAIRSGYMNLTGNSFVPTVLAEEKELGIIGWSLEDDGTVDEVIPLNNEDFMLFAVYDNTLKITLSASKNMLCSTGDALTIESALSHRKGTDGITVSYSVAEGNGYVALTDNGDDTATVVSVAEGISKIVCTASSGEVEEFYVLNKYTQSTDEVKIVSSVDKLESDGQTAKVKAVLFSASSQTAKILWKSSSSNVTLTTLGNGETLITPVSNGTATVTAYKEGDEAICDSFVVTVSGQREKETVYDLKVLVWGASLAKHPPADSLYWYGNWGMAASSEENDMAHRIVHYLEEEYYPSKVNLHILAESGFDASINNDTSATTDYTTNQYYLNLENAIKEFNPNIIVTIRTGNLQDTVDVDIAYNAYKQAYDMIYKHCPDSIVVAAHCLLRHKPMNEELYDRLAKNYTDKIFEVYDVDVHSDEKNLAREWLELGQGAVANHWNDNGHDLVAQNVVAYANEHITDVIAPSFVYLPEELTISGQNTITTQGGAVKLTVTAVPDDASNQVEWTVSDERIAIVSANGLVSALANGKVTVTATSIFDETVYDEIEITITNQPEKYTVSFKPGTTDAVTNMPTDAGYVNGTFVLPTNNPVREKYNFIGWGLTENATEAVTSVEVNSNMSVYALWEKITGFEFEGDYGEEDGFCYNFDIDGGFHVEVKDSCLKTVCTLGEKVRFNSPVVDIENKNFVTFALSCGYIDETSTVELTVKTVNGQKTYILPITNTNMTEYTADISALSGNITGFDIYVNSAPSDGMMFNIALDYVRFVSDKVFDKADGEFAFTDGRVCVSSLAFNGYTEIALPDTNAKTIVNLDNGCGFEVKGVQSIFAKAQENGTNLSFVASGDYQASANTVYTSGNDGFVENDLLSGALISHNVASIRTTGNQGLRVKASVERILHISDEVAEYGFVVARKSVIDSGKIADLILSDEYIAGKSVVYGKAYSKDEGIYTVYESEEDYDYFTAVLINIPRNKSALTATLVFRPYIKLTNGKTVYGSKVEKTVADVAQQLYINPKTDVATKAILKEILEICEIKLPATNEIYINIDKLYQ